MQLFKGPSGLLQLFKGLSFASNGTADGCEIRSDQFESMVDTIVGRYLQGNQQNPGFLNGGAKWISSIRSMCVCVCFFFVWGRHPPKKANGAIVGMAVLCWKGDPPNKKNVLLLVFRK